MTMGKWSLGNVLLTAGAAVGAVTVLAVATGYEIVLSPAMMQLVVYKGFAAAAIGLMVVGAWIGRRSRLRERSLNGGTIPGLVEGGGLETGGVARTKEKETVNGQEDTH